MKQRVKLNIKCAGLCFPSDCSEGGSEGASLGDLFRACEQGGVCPLGRGSESKGQSEFRQSFLRRAADPHLNERLHRLRILTSTLKVGPHSHSYRHMRKTSTGARQTHAHLQRHRRILISDETTDLSLTSHPNSCRCLYRCRHRVCVMHFWPFEIL